MVEPEPLLQLTEALSAKYHLRRQKLISVAQSLSEKLDAYLLARETAIALELAELHDLPRPKKTADPRACAEALLACVRELPELEERSVGTPPPSLPVSMPASKPLACAAGPESVEDLPRLLSLTSQSPLVIVGGTPHPERLAHLPAELRARIEWIDTSRQGTHAIGNLERRIRERRLLALLLLEEMVQHRHSDPLISAARSVDLPIVYGGRGGRAALRAAMAELDQRLSTSFPSSP